MTNLDNVAISHNCISKPPSCAQFAPHVYFWPCNRCFKNLHPGANCAHECKMFNFHTF